MKIKVQLQSNKRQFNRKLTIAGKVIEIVDYEMPILKGYTANRKGRKNACFTSEETKAENRSKIGQRARKTVRDTANANPQLNKFLTLTYAENMTDLKRARYDFDKFIKRLKSIHKDLQYIEVVEFQKRGAIHFHLLCNLPYVDVNFLGEKVWKLGFVRLNRLDNIDNVGAYVTKYMSKDNLDERLIGKKCYSMSKGLNKPKCYTSDKDDIEDIIQLISRENIVRSYSNEYETEYYGVVRYTQIVCSAAPNVPPPRSLWEYFLSRSNPRSVTTTELCTT